MRTKSVLNTLVVILFQVGYMHSYAALPGQVWKDSRAASQDPGTESSIVMRTAAQQRAPEPIIITYQSGELRIEAYNAPLSSILRAISARTGALIDVPPQANESVTRQIGPGPVIEVLGSLLKESRFNYLIEELGADQNGIVRVTLSTTHSDSHALQPNRIPDPGVGTSAVVIQPEGSEEDPHQKAITERSELIRQIDEMNLQIIVEETRRAKARRP